jgi:hypothetical protein
LLEHGGGAGVRDLGLYESALAKPLNLASYGQPDAADLAAGRTTEEGEGEKAGADEAVGLAEEAVDLCFHGTPSLVCPVPHRVIDKT